MVVYMLDKGLAGGAPLTGTKKATVVHDNRFPPAERAG